MNYTVSIIIPIYNEAKTIGAILKLLTSSTLVSEIICVNDGSTDRSLDVLRLFRGIKVISLERNYGKAYAICCGLLQAKGDIVVFLDADLIGFTEKNLKALIQPLVFNICDVVIGYPARKLGKFFIPLSGERAYFKKDILPQINVLQDKGYALELYLNYQFRHKKIKIVPLKGVAHVMKNKKFPLFIAMKESGIEMRHLYSEVISTKKPFSYFLHSYIQPFYLKRRL